MPAQAWVTLIVGVVGFGGVAAGLFQRTYADRRAEWWRRAAWAADHVLSREAEAISVGLEVLEVLQDSKLATNADRVLLDRWVGSMKAPDDPCGLRNDGTV
ncbi:hypothetical protein MYK68_05095 [Gordonia sp. PP30]|uniref:hypothetical protein n=1 Tax=Gordonia sp. PP30 TaxID=2935861 RepID=UPI0020001878|nr:hypothetical protein [Gordonia sp. PP30]UQE75975.1 hypothetical protein MYK68_05095 [Gordonia sp. PP30]